MIDPWLFTSHFQMFAGQLISSLVVWDSIMHTSVLIHDIWFTRRVSSGLTGRGGCSGEGDVLRVSQWFATWSRGCSAGSGAGRPADERKRVKLSTAVVLQLDLTIDITGKYVHVSLPNCLRRNSINSYELVATMTANTGSLSNITTFSLCIDNTTWSVYCSVPGKGVGGLVPHLQDQEHHSHRNPSDQEQPQQHTNHRTSDRTCVAACRS